MTEKSGSRRTLSRTVSTPTPGNTPPTSTAIERSEFTLVLLQRGLNRIGPNVHSFFRALMTVISQSTSVKIHTSLFRSVSLYSLVLISSQVRQ